VLAKVAAALVAALLCSCMSSRDPTLVAHRPSGYHPELFPDIPLPPQYVLDPDSDQLAVAYAGGAIRRFEVSMVQKANVPAQRPAELLTLYSSWLKRAGWAPVSQKDDEQRWRKEGADGATEELLVQAGRSGSRTTIQFHLRPL
jgi:hypothetical protein